jgi:hypothetical protein
MHRVKELLVLLTYLGGKHIEVQHDHAWGKEFMGTFGVNIPSVNTNSETNIMLTHSRSNIFETDLDNPLEPSIPRDLALYPFAEM